MNDIYVYLFVIGVFLFGVHHMFFKVLDAMRLREKRRVIPRLDDIPPIK